MELVKKQIHMNRWKGNVTTQVTLDDDFIVPDTMDDMAQVLLDKGKAGLSGALPERGRGTPDPWGNHSF